MKNKILILAAFILMSSYVKAQNTFAVQSQNAEHPTIASVKVMYKATPQGTVAPGAPVSVQGIPEGKINLQPGGNVSQIHFKILSVPTNSLLYSADYQASSGIVNDEHGNKLFENNNGSIFISNGQAMILKPYIYQIQTEDGQGNLSPVLSIIQ